jgi:hypothetical protein
MTNSIALHRKIFLVILILAGACVLYAHPDHKDPFKHSAEDTQSRTDFPYFFNLYAKIVYEAPAPMQAEMIDQMVKMYVSMQPWGDHSNLENLYEEVFKTYEQLPGSFYCLKVKLTDDGIVAADSLKTLDLTAGLKRPILVEFSNISSTEMQANVYSERNVLPPIAPVTIAPGEDRFLFAVFQPDINDIYSSIPIKIVNETNTLLGTIDLPVKISKAAVIKGRLKELNSDMVFPGRVYVIGNDNIYRHGKKHAGNQTLSEKPILLNVPIGENYTLPFFYSDGTFEIQVPPGDVKLTPERGHKHENKKKDVTVKPGQILDVILESGRIIDMKAKGWYSGDTHIHWVKNWWSENEKIELLAMVQQAEDLRVANNLTLLQYRPKEQGGPFIAPSQFPMGPVPDYCDQNYHIQMAEEYRNDNFYGHLNFLNIKELIQPISTGPGSGGAPDALDYPLNKTAIEQCHAQGGISIEAHNLGPFHRSDVPANVISGLSDSLDQLDPEHYYRFLDCGIQIPLTNGSDHPARLVGQCRAYVKVEGDFTYEKWIDGIRAKRTFTTSGPLLFLTVNGQDIGSELHVKKGMVLSIHAKAISRHPIGNFQIVTNHGKIIAEKFVSEKTMEFDLRISANESGWFVARCSPTENFSALNGYNIAHTSAVYVTVDNLPVCRPEAVAYWIELLKRHHENIRVNARYANDIQRQEELDYIQQAIQKYDDLLDRMNK